MDLVQKINERLESGLLPAHILMSRMRLSNESMRHSIEYTDPTHLPFYYHLGKDLAPEKLLEFGFGEGILSGCLLLSCKTVKEFLAFQSAKGQEYSARLGRANVKDCYDQAFDIHVGSVDDVEFLERLQAKRWDVILMHESLAYNDCMSRLRLAWANISADGLIIMDRINYDKSTGQAYYDFCKVSNRNPVTCNSKYGVGLIYK